MKNLKYFKAYFFVFLSVVIFIIFGYKFIFAANFLDNLKQKTASQKNEESALAQPQSITQTGPALLLPPALGTVKEIHNGNSDKVVFYIQDAHCNFEAQKNISDIIEKLVKEKKLKLVALEGSTGYIDTAIFTSFPDEKVRKEVSTYFMRKGRINGAEFYAINSKEKENVILCGIENKDYYAENLNAYRSIIPKKELVNKAARELQGILEELKKYIYSAELVEFDRTVKAHNRDEMEFALFCKFLDSKCIAYKVDIAKFNNFSNLIKTMKLEEKIDFNKTENERKEIITALVSKDNKEKNSEIFQKSLLFKIGHIEPVEFYAFLLDTAKKNRIDTAKFENLNLYYTYLVEYKKIDTFSLFNEIYAIEELAKESLFTSEPQRKLDILDKNIKIFIGMLDISLSKKEVEYFFKNKDTFAASEFVSFIETQCANYGIQFAINENIYIMDEMLPSFEIFYTMADKRDDEMVKNLSNKMLENSVNRAVLLTGGYHTDNITAMLRNAGISYIIIAPTITNPDAPNPYLEIISGKKNTLEEALVE